MRAKKFSHIIEHQNETGISAAGAQGTDSYGRVHQSSRSDDFEFAGNDTGAERATKEIANGAGIFRSKKIFKSASAPGGRAENFDDGRIGAKNVAVRVKRENAGRDIFQHGFNELAAAFEFLDGLLKIARELIDLRTRIAQLSGHGVEGADEDA